MALFMTVLLGIMCPAAVLADGWVFPTAELTAEAGICIDADTGAIIFEKNAYARMYPASITKVMTALVVLEHCALDEKVTFSYDAVYNVDAGSSNAEIEQGDVLSVEDCLYALLLKSANEAANALAEHVAGSREAFAELMNEKARSLGCLDTNFDNPSGLHSDNHYTTAYDMALIGIAAMNNADFMQIESQRSHTLAPTIRVPDGKTVYMEHQMMKNNTQYSDDRVVAGKTGYTSDAGNTLVTMAEQGDRRLVAVVLKDKMPYHYVDTATMLDMGFDQYENQVLQHESLFNHQTLRDRLVADTILPEEAKAEELETEKQIMLTLPVGSTQAGTTYKLNYNLPTAAPERAVAEITYYADNHKVGDYYILRAPSIQVLMEEVPTETKVAIASVSSLTIIGIVVFFMLGGGTAALHAKNVHAERTRMKNLKERRRKRLEAMDISEEEFRSMVMQRKQEKEQRDSQESGTTGKKTRERTTKKLRKT